WGEGWVKGRGERGGGGMNSVGLWKRRAGQILHEPSDPGGGAGKARNDRHGPDLSIGECDALREGEEKTGKEESRGRYMSGEEEQCLDDHRAEREQRAGKHHHFVRCTAADAAGYQVSKKEADGKQQEVKPEFASRPVQQLGHERCRCTCESDEGAGAEAALQDIADELRFAEQVEIAAQKRGLPPPGSGIRMRFRNDCVGSNENRAAASERDTKHA